MTVQKCVYPVLVGLLLAASLVGCNNNTVEPDPGPPDFILSDLDGNEFRLQSTQGKVVILTFFAPWCPVCQSEAPVLAELHEQYAAQGLEIVAVAVQAESIDQIRAFKADFDLPYRILVDNGLVSSAAGYNVVSVPTTYFIDREVNLYGPFRRHIEKDEFDNVVRRYL